MYYQVKEEDLVEIQIPFDLVTLKNPNYTLNLANASNSADQLILSIWSPNMSEINWISLDPYSLLLKGVSPTISTTSKTIFF